MSEVTTPSRTPGAARELTAFQRHVLVVLSKEPRYGLAVKRELEAYYDDDINHGRLYPNLDDLVDRGLVAKSERDKRTNEYRLTEAGRETLLDQFGWELGYYVTDGERADDLRELIERTT